MDRSTPSAYEWQEIAMSRLLEKWASDADAKPLIAACPGAGKTYFSANAARILIQDQRIEHVIVLSPTTNVKIQHAEEYEKLGIDAHADARNKDLKWRSDLGEHLTGDWTVLSITYSQLAAAPDVFERIALSYPTLVVGDEIHHADDKEAFGVAVERLAKAAKYRLALSGTPFNTKGGSLAMCDTRLQDGDDGSRERVADPLYSYSYGQAIAAGVCRPIEFGKVMGRGECEYMSLETDKVYKRVVDLNKANKTDKLSALMNPHGEFVGEMIGRGLDHLTRIKIECRHPKAGMLVTASDTTEGELIANRIREICDDRGLRYQVVEIYNDTPGAHERIKQLDNGSEDIIVSVAMIAEGVDIKRLRVGLYLSSTMTEMFFKQFVGRFVRRQKGIEFEESQYSIVIVPGHTVLLEFCKEIEKMVTAATVVKSNGDGNGNDVEQKNIFLGSQTFADDGRDAIYRGDEYQNPEFAREWLRTEIPQLYDLYSGHTDSEIAKLVTQLWAGGYRRAPQSEPSAKKERPKDWSSMNDKVVGTIVAQLKRLGKTNGLDLGDVYGYVNKRANNKVGISKKDKMTKPEILERRYQHLIKWRRELDAEEDVL